MSSLVSRLITKAHQLHRPIFTTIELTQLCNLTCKHCYNFDRTLKAKPHDLDQALATSEILNIITQLKELGTLWLNLSGGEPLLHSDLDQIIRHAKENHLYVRIKTNGLLLSEKRLSELKALGVDALDISLYGMSDQVYQALCGKSGATLVQHAILTAKKMSFEVATNIILTKLNLEELDQMIKWCESHQLRFQIAEEITARYDGTITSKEYAIDSNEMQQLLAGEHGHRFMYKNHDQAVQCSCAKTVLGIRFDGTVYPCIGAPIEAGHTRKDSLEHIWKHSNVFNQIRSLEKKDFKSCTSCDFIDTCNRSSGTAYINTGEYTGCDPKFLEFARLRANSKYK